MSAFDAYVQAKFHGGTMAAGPTFTVVHDAETPLRAGYADSITEFFRVGPKAGTSAHAMVDPVKAVKLLPDNVVAYAAGPKANPRGWHLEQAGYAKFKRPDWTTADGMAQLRRVGACLREVHDTWGIPKRWVTDDQLRRAAVGDRSSGGMTTHQQVARVLGGTTHTDPETNYPRDLLLQVVLDGDAAPIPIPLGDDMRLIAIPSKAVYKVTDFDVSLEPGIYRMGAIAKGWDLKVTQVSLEEFLDIKADVDDRRARLLTDIAKAAGGDIDEAAIVAGLLPQLTAALSAKTGATREDVEQVVRGVFADAAT